MAMAIGPDLLADPTALRSTETQDTHFLLLPGCLTGFIITSDIWEELESQEKGGGEGTVSLPFCHLFLRRWLVQEELALLLHAHPHAFFPGSCEFFAPHSVPNKPEQWDSAWNHMTLLVHVKTGRKPPIQIIPIWLEKGDTACDRPQKIS